MSYLLDKKNKNKKISRIALAIFVLLLIIYFWSNVFSGLSFVSQTVFRPVLILGQSIGRGFSNAGAYFASKKYLMQENENLKNQIIQSEADRANYATVLDENNKLKEILGRKNTNGEMILGTILSKPRESIYGTLIIDAGENQGIAIGQRVFALGNIPIGRIAEVYGNSAKVILFSYPKEKTEVVINGRDVFMEVIGRGIGNFEMILPRDFVLDVGTEVILPGITPYVLGTVVSIISDPRDSFQKALIASPVNIFQLKFVEVEK